MKPHQIKLTIGVAVVAIVLLGLFLWFRQKSPSSVKLHLKGSKLCIIKADGCHHCRKLRPVIAELSNLPGIGEKLVVIDGPSNRELLKKWQIVGFPTLGLLNEKYKTFTKMNIKRDKETLLNLLNQL